jgi:hypothetical protein
MVFFTKFIYFLSLILSRLLPFEYGKSGNISISGTLMTKDKEVALIDQSKIDEWIHEVEERPASAALIIQYIAIDHSIYCQSIK